MKGFFFFLLFNNNVRKDLDWQERGQLQVMELKY